MLYVERSHRTESLLEGLAERLMRPRAEPLSPAVLVVQGRGMERWIAQTIAADHGVCANTEFLFPRGLLERVFRVAESLPAASSGPGAALPDPGWQPESLTWSVARRIVTEAESPALAPLRRQLMAPDRDWRIVQLAHRIATLFDDYITYRPDWIARWSGDLGSRGGPGDAGPESLGPDEAWQASLFRGVLEDLGPGHLAHRATRFGQLLERELEGELEDGRRGGLAEAMQKTFPVPIEVFAVSTLPPLHLAVLEGLARLVDVHLSVLSPSRHYWADLWSEIRDEAPAAESRSSAQAQGITAQPTSPIARLLVGLGRLGSDFQRSLEQGPGYVESGVDRFETADASKDSEKTLLARLQLRMLDLEEGDAGAGDRLVRRDDRSLQIHLCHGPKRELEVVESALREAFDRDPTLTPDDVLVMAPDIDVLAPTIDAVFGGSGEDRDALPYRIADRGTLRRSPVAQAFVALLDLLSGRAGRSELLDWLAHEPARARLGLEADGVERLAEWAGRAGVRFGLDATHREALGLEASDLHTWAGGIDRLVLGHAVGASSGIFAGRSAEPLDRLSDPALLGAIGELESTLSDARREISTPRSVEAWSAWLRTLLERTLAHRDDNAHEHGLLRTALRSLATAASHAGFAHPIPFEAMRERFKSTLERSTPPQGFLSGGITFCELVPLRAIPFRVIVIVGLSEPSFPRRRPAASYDLMARHPRSGDRNSRSDDRYLFLEALLSTRDQLILTVPGRDLRDGSGLPPSVVLSELLDVLEAGFELEDPGPQDRLRDFLVVEHPLQSFSPRYFAADRDARLVGLDREAFEGAMARQAALVHGTARPRRFLEVLEPDPSMAPSPGLPHLRLEELERRLLRSTQVFSRARLGLRLPRPERALGDFDPTELDALDRHALGNALLADRRAGASPQATTSRLLANARVPEGEPGRLSARALQREVESMLEIASARLGSVSRVEQAFDLTLEGVGELGRARLSGVLRDLGPEGRVRLDFSRIGGRNELRYWIEHLALCAWIDEGAEWGRQSLLVARPESKGGSDRVVLLRPMPRAAARRELAQLFEWAWSVDRAPLAFFPKSSWAFASRWDESEPARQDQAWREAQRIFYGSDSKGFDHPESEEDLEQVRIWEGLQPLESIEGQPTLFRFDELARRFFEPFLEARQVLER